MFKNVGSQLVAVYAWDNAAGEAKTGDAANITAQISKDGGAPIATDDAEPSELEPTDNPGIYIFDMTQAETNADLVVISPVSATTDIVLRPVIIYTQTVMRGTDSAALAATALTDATWTNAKAAFIDAAISGRAPANEYNTPMARVDVAVSSRSSHSAANVWAVGARTLTGFGSLIADIWAYVTRTLTAVPSDGATETKQDLMQADLTFLKDIEGGKWERDGVQMIFFKSDNATEVARFNLFKFDGTPAAETDNEVAKRERV